MIVDAGARSIELQPRELEVQLRTDLSVARNAPLALYANTTCWCTFDGWSGSHNGTGDAAVQLELAQRVAIGREFVANQWSMYWLDGVVLQAIAQIMFENYAN